MLSANWLIVLNSFQQRDFQEPDFSSGFAFDFDYTEDYSTEIDYETEDSLDDGLLTSFNDNNNNQQEDFTPDFQIEAIPTTTELPLFQPTGSEKLHPFFFTKKYQLDFLANRNFFKIFILNLTVYLQVHVIEILKT